MRKICTLGFMLISACSLTAVPATAQTYSCAASNEPTTVGLQDYVVRLTGGDPNLLKKRQAYHLPAATASQVQVVKTKSVCQQAAQAYNKAVRGPSAPQISRTVVVIKVANSRYVVQDPAELQGEFNVTVIFDASFTPLVSFNG
jgi:hypothetical protein